MKMFLVLITFAGVFALLLNVTQEAKSFDLLNNSISSLADTTYHENDADNPEYDYYNKRGMRHRGSIFGRHTRPTIDVLWGLSNPKIDNSWFTGKFSNLGNGEIKLGFIKMKPKYSDIDVFEYEFNYFFVGEISSGMKPSFTKNSGETEINSWRFGFSSSEGYGYQFGKKTNLTLYSTNGWVWSKVDFTDTFISPDPKNLINTYKDDFHFGSNFEGGLRFELYEPIAINISYERIDVFPRHLFWGWLGSQVVATAGNQLLNYFIKQTANESPELTPIVNFVLKNALSYGIYELRKKSMNWPFKSEAPLMFDSFKVGLSFSF